MTGRTLLLHIGMPKTGTTSVQGWMTAHAEDGDIAPGMAVYLPRRRVMSSMHLLWALFRPAQALPPWLRHEVQRLGGEEAVRLSLEQAWDRIASAEHAAVSSEFLPGWTHEELAALRDRARTAGFTRTMALMYVRHPEDYFLSRQQQLIKVRPELEDPHAFNCRYQLSHDKMAAVFDEVRVRPFERSLLRNGCVVQDVVAQWFDVAGRGDPPAGIVAPALNESLSVEAMELLQDLHAAMARDAGGGTVSVRHSGVLDDLRDAQAWLPLTKPALLPAIGAAVFDGQRQDLAFLAGQGIHFAPRSPAPPAAPPTGREVADLVMPGQPEARAALAALVADGAAHAHGLPLAEPPGVDLLSLLRRAAPDRLPAALGKGLVSPAFWRDQSSDFLCVVPGDAFDAADWTPVFVRRLAAATGRAHRALPVPLEMLRQAPREVAELGAPARVKVLLVDETLMQRLVARLAMADLARLQRWMAGFGARPRRHVLKVRREAGREPAGAASRSDGGYEALPHIDAASLFGAWPPARHVVAGGALTAPARRVLAEALVEALLADDARSSAAQR